MSAKTYRTVPVRNLSSDELLELSKKQKLSLSREDMEVVQVKMLLPHSRLPGSAR